MQLFCRRRARKYKIILEKAPEKPKSEYLCKLIDNQVSILTNKSETCMWHKEVLAWCAPRLERTVQRPPASQALLPTATARAQVLRRVPAEPLGV